MCVLILCYLASKVRIQIDQADSNWNSFLPSNIIDKTNPNPEVLSTNT